MRLAPALLACLAVSGCGTVTVPGVTFGGPPLISAQSPRAAVSANAEPQPPNSLPPGAEGIGPTSPNSRFPNYGSITLPSPI